MLRGRRACAVSSTTEGVVRKEVDWEEGDG